MQIIRIATINGGTKGCERAPVEVVKALKNIKSNEKNKLIEFEKLNLEEIHTDPRDLEEAGFLIFKNSLEVFEKNSRCFFIGGDHSISYPILRAFEKAQENPLLIVFDSHSDCEVPKKVPGNQEWLRKLIEKGWSPRNIILVSSRNLSSTEMDFLAENKLTLIKREILEEDLAGVCDIVTERARNSGGFYISIDIDCVDPAFAPGACDLEPGGLSSRELIYFIKRLSLLENFRGADIVEINPDRDINGMTAKLGAKLIAEMI
jgi:arginase